MINETIARHKSVINETLLSLFMPTLSKRLDDATNYALKLPGKRLRPLVTLAVAETLGVPLEKALSTSLAVELVHTYSLIHDDLPCMDDDELRRGMPTLHVVFDEATALLTGSLLLTAAFEHLTLLSNIDPDKKVALIRALAYASGGCGMIGGQMLDMFASTDATSLEYISAMHTGKTGALLGYSFEAGGILGGFDNLHALRTIGNTIGFAFQIIDDVLDATAQTEVIGKTAGKDRQNNKVTVLSFLSQKEALSLADSLLDGVQRKTRTLLGDAPLLEALLDKLIRRVS